MIVYEFKLKGKEFQFRVVDEMIRTAQFVRNMALRYWMDNRGIKLYDLNKYCAILAKQFEWAKKLNSQARQASAERTAFAIQRFFANCKAQKPGKKGYPQFQKNNRSVEYKTTGWKLAEDRKHITFTDGFAAGEFKLIGTWDLCFYQPEQVKRVRIVRRADGYYAQFCIDAERRVETVPAKHNVGIDVGLLDFYTDSDGNKIDNPRHLRKSEKALKRQQRRVSKKKKGSNNRKKTLKRLGRKHLKVSRQRKDFAVKKARCVVHSNDVVAYEDLKVRNMVRNRKLAKSISDAGWSQFFEWLQYFGKIFGKIVIAVPPQYTSQECSQCRKIVKKALSQRTHICQCGCVLDRDENAALNILAKGLKQYPGALENFAKSCHSEVPSRQQTFQDNASGQTNLYLLDESLASKLTG